MFKLAGLVRRRGVGYAALFVLVGGSAYAAAGGVAGDDPVRRIYACVTSVHHTLNLSRATEACPAGQTKISWNAEGPPGKRGPGGTAGRRGAQGTTGRDGPQGAQGSKGDTGDTGAQGPKGETGDTGPTGAPGAAGTLSSVYAYMYNLGAQTVAKGSAIVFSNNGEMSSGITHTAGTTDVTVTTAGTYEIDFSVTLSSTSQVVLYLNGVARNDMRFGTSNAGEIRINRGHGVVTLAANDVLTVRNDTNSTSTMSLTNTTGGTSQIANATLLIRRLS